MSRITMKDTETLARELASFARAGIPVPEGLHQLSRSLGPGPLQTLAASAAARVEQGTPLSEALSASGVGVPGQLIALVRCGEMSGDMRGLLEFAVEHSRRVARHRAALLTTLVYPAFVLIVLVLSMAFVFVAIIPKFQDLFYEMGAELPALTRTVVGIARLLEGPLGLAALAAVLVALVTAIFSSAFHDWLYRVMGYLPGFDFLVSLSDTAVSMKFLASTVSRGVPLPDALAAASLAVFTPDSRSMLGAMAKAAAQGHKVGPMLAGRTPATAAWLFRQAEEAGDLAGACAGIASYCEDRFERVSKRSVAILEPVLLLLVSVVVGIVLLSSYLPLFNIPKIMGAD
jgi:type IV pilus assembly protein PilC